MDVGSVASPLGARVERVLQLEALGVGAHSNQRDGVSSPDVPSVALAHTVPDANMAPLGTTEPPVGSAVMPSRDALGEPASVKVTNPGDLPRSPSEIVCPSTTPHSW